MNINIWIIKYNLFPWWQTPCLTDMFISHINIYLYLTLSLIYMLVTALSHIHSAEVFCWTLTLTSRGCSGSDLLEAVRDLTDQRVSLHQGKNSYVVSHSCFLWSSGLVMFLSSPLCSLFWSMNQQLTLPHLIFLWIFCWISFGSDDGCSLAALWTSHWHWTTTDSRCSLRPNCWMKADVDTLPRV